MNLSNNIVKQSTAMKASEAKERTDKSIKDSQQNKIDSVIEYIKNVVYWEERYYTQINDKEHIYTFNALINNREYFEKELGYEIEIAQPEGDSTKYAKISWENAS